MKRWKKGPYQARAKLFRSRRRIKKKRNYGRLIPLSMD